MKSAKNSQNHPGEGQIRKICLTRYQNDHNRVINRQDIIAKSGKWNRQEDPEISKYIYMNSWFMTKTQLQRKWKGYCFKKDDETSNTGKMHLNFCLTSP